MHLHDLGKTHGIEKVRNDQKAFFENQLKIYNSIHHEVYTFIWRKCNVGNKPSIAFFYNIFLKYELW